MAAAIPYLLDTNVVLLITRENNAAAAAIDHQFQLRASPFRPAICEVTVAELLAFAESWGQERRKRLDEVIDDLLVVPIMPRSVHSEWAKLRSYAKSRGLAIQHDHNDLWIGATANVAGLTVIASDAKGFWRASRRRPRKRRACRPEVGPAPSVTAPSISISALPTVSATARTHVQALQPAVSARNRGPASR